MKSIILVIALLSMNLDPDFETFLNKDINEISYIGSLSKSDQKNMYWIFHSDIEFYGKPFERLFITTNEDKAIKSITLYFSGIQKSLQEKLSDEYGDVSRVTVLDEVLYDGPEEEIDGLITKESFITVKEGDINGHEPLYLFWNKDDFQIRLFYNKANNVTEACYRLSIEEF